MWTDLEMGGWHVSLPPNDAHSWLGLRRRQNCRCNVAACLPACTYATRRGWKDTQHTRNTVSPKFRTREEGNTVTLTCLYCG